MRENERVSIRVTVELTLRLYYLVFFPFFWLSIINPTPLQDQRGCNRWNLEYIFHQL